MDKAQINPCPLCGEQINLRYDSATNLWEAACPGYSCLNAVKIFGENMEDVIYRWNNLVEESEWEKPVKCNNIIRLIDGTLLIQDEDKQGWRPL